MSGHLTSLVPELADTALAGGLKGIPLGAATTLAELPAWHWNIARGDLQLPTVTLDAAQLHANIATMQRYCEREGVLLAPHGKTTMSPQLFAAQLAAGAWAMTAATPAHVAVMRSHAVGRIILANEIVEPAALRWIVEELNRDPEFEFFCLADSPATVRAMEQILAEQRLQRPLQVLIEIGDSGGRAGARTVTAAVAVARAIAESPHMSLAGLEAYEGSLTDGGDTAAFAKLDHLFVTMRESVRALSGTGLLDRDEIIVTAGGSAYFDRVVAAVAAWPQLPEPVRLVLRSGCYIAHDHGEYEALSPLAGRRAEGEELRLHNALTLWAAVLSRPEPDLVIVGAGIRDVGVDSGPPTARALWRGGARLAGLAGTAETYRVMDQHLFLRVPPALDIEPGDIVTFAVSHPCTTFDKYRFIPVIDSDHDVIDGILTCF